MLQCLPQRICSWDYRVPATEEPGAELYFNFWGEQGRIVIGQDILEVEKAGFMSGRWSLLRSGKPVGAAFKPNPFLRKFDIDCDGVPFSIQAASILFTSFEIVSGGRRVGSIERAHPFTRRASIDCTPEISYLGQLFAFWLVVMMWRRAARSQSSSAAAGGH